MKLAHSGEEFELTLTAREVVLLISTLAHAINTHPSDQSMKVVIGWHRQEVLDFTDQLAGFYRKVHDPDHP